MKKKGFYIPKYAIQTKREKGMHIPDHITKWQHNALIPFRFYKLNEDKEGWKADLQSSTNPNHLITLNFGNSVYAYRSTVHSLLTRPIEHFLEIDPQLKNGNIFIVNNSSYIKQLRDASYQMLLAEKAKHFVILDEEWAIEIIALAEPIIKSPM